MGYIPKKGTFRITVYETLPLKIPNSKVFIAGRIIWKKQLICFRKGAHSLQESMRTAQVHSIGFTGLAVFRDRILHKGFVRNRGFLFCQGKGMIHNMFSRQLGNISKNVRILLKSSQRNIPSTASFSISVQRRAGEFHISFLCGDLTRPFCSCRKSRAAREGKPVPRIELPVVLLCEYMVLHFSDTVLDKFHLSSIHFCRSSLILNERKLHCSQWCF